MLAHHYLQKIAHKNLKIGACDQMMHNTIQLRQTVINKMKLHRDK